MSLTSDVLDFINRECTESNAKSCSYISKAVGAPDESTFRVLGNLYKKGLINRRNEKFNSNNRKVYFKSSNSTSEDLINRN